MKDIYHRAISLDVWNECQKQDKQWGADRNHDTYTWLAILVEEVGESAQAALQTEYGGKHAGTLRKELIQVVAVAYQWIDCLDRNENNS